MCVAAAVFSSGRPALAGLPLWKRGQLLLVDVLVAGVGRYADEAGEALGVRGVLLAQDRPGSARDPAVDDGLVEVAGGELERDRERRERTVLVGQSRGRGAGRLGHTEGEGDAQHTGTQHAGAEQ